MNNFTFIDLFAGIGGFHQAAKSLGGQCVFASEIDQHASKAYEDNYGITPFGDITKVNPNDIPNHDLLCAGFPCQPFSVAGYRQGFEDEKGRGNLFYDIVKILNNKHPKTFILENVKNLSTHDKGNTIKVIYNELENLGYFVKHKVLNTMEYGNLPQNRERIYIVGFLDEKSSVAFNFPEKTPLVNTIVDCLEDKVEDKYYYTGKPLYSKLKDDIIKKNTVYQWRRKYVRENKSNVCPTLTANMGTGGHNVPLVLDKKDIRKLTPRECANFQGFPQDYQLPDIADSHLYKQFGNSVSIPVIKAITNNINKALNV